MPILHAIVLGLVQGLSEFLPISSSGHLLLVPWLLDWNDLDDPSVKKSFDVALHLGTFVAVVAYFRRELVVYVREGVRLLYRRERPVTAEGRIAWLLVVATLPAAAVGALFEEWIDEQLGTPTIIAISLIGFGVLLWWADRLLGRRTVDEFNTRDALLVGAAQALALNPGTSRSGITITAARQIGFDRDSAARLSFLMSIPVIAGAVVLKVGGMLADGVPDDLVVPMIVGIVTSGISGWVAVWGTLRLVRTRTFTPFVVYRIALGALVLVVVAAGWR
ncbi:MAG: undecaprenyl-diphosphate phosphatase [Ilumatobacter sp.]|uniref:undecaprenyl-diphosphate phosphatase n=1 Tax=Ilumatobacter sp. TaxID=1967498 RepID=UPI002639E489|nr:undecaprenyl-diphosphate phosphatase [Ilumatobacter sp.]MDJ0767690.1 undecaprenyl-diphosphate phosphatase [Ilumatobacter sp.]